MNYKYDISIIIPFFNGNQYINRTLRCIYNSIAYAKILKVEVIIVNDSPDVKLVLSKYNLFNITVISNEVNKGIHYSRVIGIKASKGKYILMLDQDDLITKTALLSQYNKINNFDMIISNGFDENPNNFGKIYRSPRHQNASLEERYYYYVGCMIVSPGQCLIKKKAIPTEWLESIIKHNGTDDLLLWILMMNNNKKISVNYDETYIHSYTGENVSSNFEAMKESAIETIHYLKHNGIVSKKYETIFMKRLKMRKIYEGKSILYKLIAFMRYPLISKELIKLKRM